MVTNQTLKENTVKAEVEKAEKSNDEAKRLSEEIKLQELQEQHKTELNKLKKYFTLLRSVNEEVISYKKLLYDENDIEYKEDELVSSNSLLHLDQGNDLKPFRYDSVVEIAEQTQNKRGSEEKTLLAKISKEEQPEEEDREDNEGKDHDDINVDDY